ncbi:hypothetical protein BDV3_005626 [Batrachochytrium dendrobatidis]
MHSLAAIDCVTSTVPPMCDSSDCPYPSPIQSPQSVTKPSTQDLSLTITHSQMQSYNTIPHKEHIDLTTDNWHSFGHCSTNDSDNIALMLTVSPKQAGNDASLLPFPSMVNGKSIFESECSNSTLHTTGIDITKKALDVSIPALPNIAIIPTAQIESSNVEAFSTSATVSRRKQNKPARSIARSSSAMMSATQNYRIVQLDVYDAFKTNPKQLLSTPPINNPSGMSNDTVTSSTTTDGLPSAWHRLQVAILPSESSKPLRLTNTMARHYRFRRFGHHFSSIASTPKTFGSTCLSRSIAQTVASCGLWRSNLASKAPGPSLPNTLSTPVHLPTPASSSKPSFSASVALDSTLKRPLATISPVSSPVVSTTPKNNSLAAPNRVKPVVATLSTKTRASVKESSPTDGFKKLTGATVKRRSSIASRQPKPIPNFLANLGVDTSVFNNSEFSETKGAPVVFWKTGSQPLKFPSGLSMADELTKEELQTCATLRIYPDVYYNIKKTMLQAVAYYGPFKKREAQTWFRIDVNKICIIYDWFKSLGWIPNDGEWATAPLTSQNPTASTTIPTVLDLKNSNASLFKKNRSAASSKRNLPPINTACIDRKASSIESIPLTSATFLFATPISAVLNQEPFSGKSSPDLLTSDAKRIRTL